LNPNNYFNSSSGLKCFFEKTSCLWSRSRVHCIPKQMHTKWPKRVRRRRRLSISDFIPCYYERYNQSESRKVRAHIACYSILQFVSTVSFAAFVAALHNMVWEIKIGLSLISNSGMAEGQNIFLGTLRNIIGRVTFRPSG